KREWMFSRRQIASLIRMCWSRNEPSQSSSNPERQFTEVECSGHRLEHFGPGETIRSTTLHPLTPPYEIGRELARRRCYADRQHRTTDDQKVGFGKAPRLSQRSLSPAAYGNWDSASMRNTP